MVIPNQHETGRAHVVVLNWANQDNVSVDLSGIGLQLNQRYEIHAVQDYYGAVTTNTYTGQRAQVAMTNWTVAQPRSLTLALSDTNWTAAHPSATPLPSTFPRFGAFVVTPIIVWRPPRNLRFVP